jgi:hypothetical protein
MIGRVLWHFKSTLYWMEFQVSRNRNVGGGYKTVRSGKNSSRSTWLLNNETFSGLMNQTEETIRVPKAWKGAAKRFDLFV